jgi:hypothetical protein
MKCIVESQLSGGLEEHERTEPSPSEVLRVG